MKIDYNYGPAWDLICSGNTTGIFQLESSIGQHYSKLIKPRSIEELADVISLIRPGCISGDTKILVSTSLNGEGKTNFHYKTLEELFKNKDKYDYLISFDEKNGGILKNKVLDIFLTGCKPTYKVKIKTYRRRKESHIDYNLKCTLDHKVLTPSGWKEVSSLNIGDRFAILKKRGKSGRHKVNPEGMKYFREICYQNYEYKCVFCDWKEASLDVNHLEGNRFSNNKPENLCFLCPNHHRMYSEKLISKTAIKKARKKYKLPQKERLGWAEFNGLEYCGEENVYDISMNAPHHNFIAGNVIVHNCLQAYMEDGKNLTEHYAMRKHGHEEASYLIPQLESVLKDTYGILVYQEQAISIGTKLAGLSPGDADYYIRKVIGKKKTDMMEQTVKLILDGFKKNGINEKKGLELVNWIKAGQRYSFNKSHAVAFAYHSYKSAYAKALKMQKFFQVYLKHAKHKIKPKIEIRKIVQNARASEINICQPDIRLKNKEFDIINGKTYVGITDIKNVGDRIYSIIEQSEIPDTWFGFLTDLSPKLKSSAIPLIQAGCCDFYHLDRKKMEYEVKIFERFSDLEKKKIKDLGKPDLLSSISMAVDTLKLAKNRKIVFEAALKDLEQPAYTLEYSCEQLEKMEIDLIGAPLSCTRLDGNVKTAVTNVYCIDIIKGNIPKKAILAGIVREPRFIKTKKGDDMCFFSLEDHTGTVTDLVAFKECLEEYRYNITEDLTVLIEGVKSNKGTLIVNRVIEI